jgi:hypothetical protein
MSPQNDIPRNIAAEEATIGSVLIDPEAITWVDLEAEEFYLKKHAVIWRALLKMHQHGQPIDFITLSEELARHRQLSTAGGQAELARLARCVPSATNIDAYAQMVHEKAIDRAAIEISTDLASAAYNPNGKLFEILPEIQARVADLAPRPDDDDEEDEVDEVPPLPEEIVIDDDLAATAGTWIDQYIDYANNVSPMTPRAFHESAALWLISSAVARRVVLKMAFDNIYPNLWVAWVAPSTLFGKTTSMNVATRIAYNTFPHLMAAEDMTPEGLILDMAGHEPSNLSQMTIEDQASWTKRRDYSAQRAWAVDEFSGLLASSGKDYNAGLLTTLMKFYNCQETYERVTAGRGMQTINHSYLTLLAASTPAALTKYLLSDGLWSNGWWPRFALLAPESKRPGWAEPTEQDPPSLLIARVRKIYERLPDPAWPDPPADVPAKLGPGSFNLWNRYNRALRYDLLNDALDHRLWAAYGRLPVTALKVATLLAVLDWPEADPIPTVEGRHVMRAIVITEQWRRSAHRVLLLATHQAEDKLAQRIIQQIQKRSGGATLRDLYKSMRRTKTKTIERVLSDLVMRGELQEIEYQNPRGGPKTKKYVVG